MAVTVADILPYTSASAGSTGGAITASSITSGVAENVIPNITDAERIAGDIDYRKIFWKNNNGTDSMVKPVLFNPDGPDNATMKLGLGINHTDDDDPAQGNMSAWSAAAKVALISDGADTRVATIWGLDNAGTPVPTREDVVLTGAAEVLSVATFSKVWRVDVASTSGSRTVTVKQGTGGTARGSIPPNAIGCWLWVTATSEGAGIKLPDLAPAQSYGVWQQLTVAAGATPTRPNSLTVRIKESI